MAPFQSSPTQHFPKNRFNRSVWPRSRGSEAPLKGSLGTPGSCGTWVETRWFRFLVSPPPPPAHPLLLTSQYKSCPLGCRLPCGMGSTFCRCVGCVLIQPFLEQQNCISLADFQEHCWCKGEAGLPRNVIFLKLLMYINNINSFNYSLIKCPPTMTHRPFLPVNYFILGKYFDIVGW